VPKFEVVTERILHQERKSKDKLSSKDGALVLQKHFRQRTMGVIILGDWGTSESTAMI